MVFVSAELSRGVSVARQPRASHCVGEREQEVQHHVLVQAQAGSHQMLLVALIDAARRMIGRETEHVQVFIRGECRSVYGSVFFAPGPGLIILRQIFVSSLPELCGMGCRSPCAARN
jgi:hypothetical protein